MKIFVLQNPRSERGDSVTDYVPVDGSRTGAAARCPVCEKFIGMLPLLPPVRVELEGWGSQWGDVAFGPGDQILISEKLRTLSAEAGLIGFARLDAANVVKVKRHKSAVGEPPRYHLASIQRSRAVVDGPSSGLVQEETPTCADCCLDGIIKRVRRIVLQPKTWSGEDVFFARGLPGTILVSERFKQLCDENHLANCSLVAAEKFGFDHYPQERAASGPVEH
jgi:hypothetical protein